MREVVNHNLTHIVRVRPRNLLLDWVNLDDAKLLGRNPDLRNIVKSYSAAQGAWLEDVRRSLRRAWDARDNPRDREWYLFTARWQYEQARMIDAFGEFGRFLYPAAPRDRFHEAVFDLQDSGAVHKLSKCAFEGCHTPYFIRRRQKKQPYCSTVCHGKVTAEIKRRWHRENRGKGAKRNKSE